MSVATTNSPAQVPYTVPRPAAKSSPPMAGPATIAACMPAELKAVARASMSSGTSAGTSDCEAAICSGRTAPSTTDRPNSSERDSPCHRLAVISTSATATCASWQAWMMRTRWKRSAAWPAGNVNASAGRNCSRPTRPRSQALPVSRYMCQPMASIRIWLAATPAMREHQ